MSTPTIVNQRIYCYYRCGVVSIGWVEYARHLVSEHQDKDRGVAREWAIGSLRDIGRLQEEYLSDGERERFGIGSEDTQIDHD